MCDSCYSERGTGKISTRTPPILNFWVWINVPFKIIIRFRIWVRFGVRIGLGVEWYYSSGVVPFIGTMEGGTGGNISEEQRHLFDLCRRVTLTTRCNDITVILQPQKPQVKPPDLGESQGDLNKNHNIQRYSNLAVRVHHGRFTNTRNTTPA